MIDSRMVAWFTVWEYVQKFLPETGSWPLAGTPSWGALDDDDPRKIAAVLAAGVNWALRVDTLQAEMVETSREISTLENWNTQRRRMFNHAHRIPRKKAS